MRTAHKSNAAVFLEHFPLATAIHLLAALALAIVFVANGGNLPDDAPEFFAILIGGNAGLSVGRGLATFARNS
jgi:hypothetical protein